jgi:hypothetical protein
MSRVLVTLLVVFGPGFVRAEPTTTTNGSLGLVRMSVAEVGPPGRLRLGLHGELYRGSEVLVSAPDSSGDRDTRVRGGVSVGLTPWRFLEVFAALAAGANRNQRICTHAGGLRCVSEPGREDPEVLKAPSALSLGGKVARPLRGGLSVGTELGFVLRSPISRVGIDVKATSVWLSGLGGWNLRPLARIPLHVHVALGYIVDNGRAVRDLSDMAPTSQLVYAFAYGLERDRARGSVGLASLLRLRRFGLRPSFEYCAEVITAAADAAFPAAGGRHDRDRHGVLFGLALLHASGFGIGAGVELALRDASLAYGPPGAPYNVLLTVHQTLDVARPAPSTIPQ